LYNEDDARLDALLGRIVQDDGKYASKRAAKALAANCAVLPTIPAANSRVRNCVQTIAAANLKRSTVFMSNFKNRQSAEILNSVYKNAEMAFEASGDVLKRCKNTHLYNEIATQRERYKNIAEETRTELSRRGAVPKQTSPYAKAMARMSIAMQTAGNQSGTKLATLMIRGTTAGIIDMQRTVNRSRAAEQQIRDDAEALLSREQDYCDRLKRYL
jgi:hypothetical protein